MSDTPNNQQFDPLAIALEAINDFDRSQLPATISSAGTPIVPPRDLYRRAALRVAYAQAAELRQQTAMLAAIAAQLDGIEELLTEEVDDDTA